MNYVLSSSANESIGAKVPLVKIIDLGFFLASYLKI